MTMEQYIEKLKTLDENEEIKQFIQNDEESVKLWFNGTADIENVSDELKKLYEDVIGDTCYLFIESDGQHNYTNSRELARLSEYRITCGERDSFGWLTGIVNLKNFSFCYG